MKKFISLTLALVVALALAIPAMAGDDNKIEDEYRLALIEKGVTFSTDGYSEIYVKQSLDVLVWVKADDIRSDDEIMAAAKESDKSLDKEGGNFIIIRGDSAGEVELFSQGNTAEASATVSVTNGIMHVVGTISHLTFPNSTPPELIPDGPGTISAVFTVNKYVVSATGTVPGAGFHFAIYNAAGEEVGTMISGEDGIASTTVDLPAGIYTVKEIEQDLGLYEENTQELKATVEEGSDAAIFEIVDEEELNTFINVPKGKLEVSVDSVVQQYIKQIHENEYKLYSEGTLVSHIASVSGAELPAGITGSYLKNGMTYLTITRKALEEAGEDGVNIGIATSDPQKGKKTSWNTPAPAPLGESSQPSYNLKIEGGKLVVTSDLPNIGVCLYSAKGTVNGPKDVKHLTGVKEASYSIPQGATFKFFLHIEDTEYYTNEIIGCKLVSSEVLEKAYDCELAMTVTQAAEDGTEIPVYSGAVKTVDKLSAGTYTVTITVSVDGEVVDTWTETADVAAGETVPVDFGKLIVSEMGAPEIVCPQECGQIKMIPLAPAGTVEP